MKLRSFLLILVAAMAFAKGPGGASGAKNTITNVTTIVHDTDAAGAQVLLRSDDYNGSGEATYSASSSMSSYIFNDGRYFLRLYSQSLRTLYITPNDPIDASQPMAPPPGYYWQNVELVFGCYDQNLNLVAFQNILTSSGNCKMILDFGDNDTEYALVMGPTASLPAPGPATGLVTVTCNSLSGGHCVNWTITPNSTASSGNPPTVANLYVFTGNHRTPLAIVGQYYQTFRIDVTNP
jgi:hypothetical protein